MDSYTCKTCARVPEEELSEHLLTELPEIAPHPIPVQAIPDGANVGQQTRILLRVWHKVLQGRCAPKRADITMAHVRDAVHWLWVARVDSERRDYRMRLIGDGIVRVLGRNDTGKLLSEAPKTHFTRHMQALCRSSHSHVGPFRLGPMMTRLANAGVCMVELSAIPLSDDGQTVTGLMGTFEQLSVHPLDGGTVYDGQT